MNYSNITSARRASAALPLPKALLSVVIGNHFFRHRCCHVRSR
ncbi:hypothetical protein [Stenoxybacter acetivorans]|nr:hypothetical protein [Stenoxybacter acetivorans]